MYPKLKRKYLTKYVILTRNILLGRDEIIFHIPTLDTAHFIRRRRFLKISIWFSNLEARLFDHGSLFFRT